MEKDVDSLLTESVREGGVVCDRYQCFEVEMMLCGRDRILEKKKPFILPLSPHLAINNVISSITINIQAEPI